MKVCLATLETSSQLLEKMKENELNYGLTSYYYLQGQNQLDLILSKINKSLLIDSGAHSFQHGIKVNFDDFVNKYIQFVKENTNNPKIEGFFEMDVDNVIGYEKVLEYRKKLEAVSDKIIPVWHKNRGIKDFIDMCKKYKGKKIAITGIKNIDIVTEQYNIFINTAHKYGCKIHILGFTRYELIKDLNLGKDDSVDSSSWRQTGIFGGINAHLPDKTIFKCNWSEGLRIHHTNFMYINYYTAKRIQEMYEDVDNSVYKVGD